MESVERLCAISADAFDAEENGSFAAWEAYKDDYTACLTALVDDPIDALVNVVQDRDVISLSAKRVGR